MLPYSEIYCESESENTKRPINGVPKFDARHLLTNYPITIKLFYLNNEVESNFQALRTLKEEINVSIYLENIWTELTQITIE